MEPERRLSSFLVIATLSSVLLQPVNCDQTGNPTLSSLEVEADGLNRVVGFSSGVQAL